MIQNFPSGYYTTERKELLAFLRPHGPFETALDVGCAAGVFGASLVETGLVSACDGIEPVTAAATAAGSKLRRVWPGMLEEVADQVPWDGYNLIVMADVLEHLVDPWATLQRLGSQAATGCRLLLSVPNVRHYKVSFPLLFQGEFRYADFGIMDRTHLHFFTYASLMELLAESGWQSFAVGSHMKSRYRKAWVPTRWLEPFVAVQYFVLAGKK
jgi:2-polyprenyl-3-methyl-5-hydroxy-6-metoxy-1,4-benzoquinol methylase